MVRHSRRSDLPPSSTERSSDEEAVDTISSPRSSKKRRSHRSSRHSSRQLKTRHHDEEANNTVRDSRRRRSHRSSRYNTEPSSEEGGRNLEVRDSHRKSERRRSRRSSRNPTEPFSGEDERSEVMRRSETRRSHRSSKITVESSSDEEEANEVFTTTSKTRHSRSTSFVRRKDNCRLMVGACICTVGIFLAVITGVLVLQRKDRIHTDGMVIPSDPPTPQQHSPQSAPTRKPTPSPTNKLTFSPAPSSTFQPTKSPTFRPSPVPTDKPSAFPSEAPTSKPSFSPTASPTRNPSNEPTTTFQPTFAPTVDRYPRGVALQSRESIGRGQFRYSRNGRYRVGLSTIGEFVLLDSASNVIWKAEGATGAQSLLLQGDGNLVMLDANGNSLWSTATSTSSASLFLIDDGGIIGLAQTFRLSTESTYVWMKGVPRQRYTGPPQGSAISFPVRVTFYYPWFPETWTVGGKRARFAPDVGWYHSGDPTVVRKHIEQLEYGRIDLAVAAWFGIDTNNDIARITQLLEETEAHGSPLKWALYYEMFEKIRTVEEIQRDLEYIKKWYAWHPSYAHVGGRPVIFIYQSKGCDIIQNWVDASQGEWYLVPKIFEGYGRCSAQLHPGKYHQYAPAHPIKEYDGQSFTISPGFWKANETEPRLARLDQTTWCQNVQKMVNSNAPWQLVTTFNEAGEGTIIEPSRVNWPSASGYGIYLDCLHNIY